MPTSFSRTLTSDALAAEENLLDETRALIRAHLSAVTSTDDDENVHADEVVLREEDTGDGGVWVCGSIDREPVAEYLREGFDPDDEARTNPLSVPSEFDEPSTADGDGA